MAKAFYARLALSNLWRNRRMYGPYAIAASLMSGMYFIILNLAINKAIANLSYGETVQAMFLIGIIVMSLFTVGYMLYINSFLIKRRKKEFGLYAVLGMERRHVTRVILLENAMLSVGSLLLGMVGGAVFGRLAFLLLMRMLDTAPGSRFALSFPALAITVLVFMAIFLLAALYNVRQVRTANPAELLTGERRGERRVRFALPMTILGVALLFFAYGMAIRVNMPALALLYFWPAVILVILATWLLFTGGSVFILGALKRNKRIYYRPQSFIAISGLMHRMKQNAAGLANICILSTMVVVTVSCCAALYVGQEVILSEQNPSDVAITLRLSDRERQDALVGETLETAQAMARGYGVGIEDTLLFHFARQDLIFDGERLIYDDGMVSLSSDLPGSTYLTLYVVPEADYVRETGDAGLALAADEVLLLTEAEGPIRGLRTLDAEGGSLRVRDVRSGTPFTLRKNAPLKRTLYVIVPDEATGQRFLRAVGPGSTEESRIYRTMLLIDLEESDQETGLAFTGALMDRFIQEASLAVEAGGGQGSYYFEDIYTSRVDALSLYGGLLFLGVFFALLFLINTVLILYFKQVSEGFDDRERFVILQKVGLSDEEVRGTINRQMLIVFLLPLVGAMVHMLAASNMIRQMLSTFMLTDVRVTMLSILITSAIFIAAYLIVYRLTARTYYRLVKW